jgi:hypothetical protein
MGEAMPLFTEGVRRKTARTIRYHVQYSTKRRNLQGILQRFFSFLGQNAENGKNAAFFREFLPFL